MGNAQTFVFAAFLCLAVSAFALITVPSRGGDTLNGFILARRRLKQRSIVASLTGTNAALANVVFLYAYWGFTYGAAGLVWGGIFWIAGLTVFLAALRFGRLKSLLRADQPALGLNEILGGEFRRSRTVVRATALASGLTFLFLLSLEVGVGSNAAIRLVSETPAASFGFSPEALIVGGALVILVSTYGYVGGFPMVVRTDVWQTLLILAGLFSALALCGVLLNNAGTALGTVLSTHLRHDRLFSWTWELAPFVLGSLFSWGVWFLCTMDSWQRALAADPAEERRLRPAAIVAGMVLLVFVSGISSIIGMTVHEIWSASAPPAYPVIEFVGYIKQLTTASELNGFLVALVMAGFLAAMASTVDTYMVVVGHCFGGDLWNRESLSSYVGTENERPVLARIRTIGIIAPLVGLAGFALIHTLGRQDNFTLYMLAGSIPMSLLPVCAWSIWRSNVTSVPDGRITAVGILVAVASSMLVNYLVAGHALSTFDARFFGLLYFIPAFTAAIAAIFLVADIRLTSIDTGQGAQE